MLPRHIVHSKYIMTLLSLCYFMIVCLIDVRTTGYFIKLIDASGILDVASLHPDEESSGLGDPVVLVLAVIYDTIVATAAYKLHGFVKQIPAAYYLPVWVAYNVAAWQIRSHL